MRVLSRTVTLCSLLFVTITMYGQAVFPPAAGPERTYLLKDETTGEQIRLGVRRLVVVDPQVLTVTTISLPDCINNAAYVAPNLLAGGGSPPYTWNLSAGSLPTGVTLSAAGVWGGSCTGSVGLTSFTIRATDAVAATATRAVSINVLASTAVPAGWNTVDIGTVVTPGSSTYAASVFTLGSSGADIGDPADNFRYTYTTCAGDCDITAQVTSLSGLSGAQAGVMFRDTLNPDSVHMMSAIQPSGGGNQNVSKYRQITSGAYTEISGQKGSSGPNASADSDTYAFPNPVGFGRLLVCAGAVFRSSGAPSSITVSDTLSNTWTVELGTVLLTNQRSFIAYALANATGSDTVTVNPAGGAADRFSFGCDEFSGAASAPVLDVSGPTTIATSSVPANTFTTAAANALIVGVVQHSNPTTTFTPGASATQIAEEETNDTTNQGYNAVFRTTTAPTSYTLNWTLGPAITVGNSTVAQSSNKNAVTTTAMSTTGASLLVVAVAEEVSVSAPVTITDSQSNTWVALASSGVNRRSQFFYAANPTTSASHTFTATRTNSLPAIAVVALVGTKISAPFDVQNGASVDPGTSLAAGSVTPSENDQILLTSRADGDIVGLAIGGSFTILQSIASNANAYGVALASKLQTTAGAENPTWSWTNSNYAGARIATFKAEPRSWATQTLSLKPARAGAQTTRATGASGQTWLKVRRIGNQFQAFSSTDNVTYVQVGLTQTIAMGTTINAGLALTNQQSNSAASATFASVSVVPTALPPVVDSGNYRPHYKGYGVDTPGGRGGTVCKVTTLEDAGAGTLRSCLLNAGPQIIVFERSGRIQLTTPLVITNGYVTIAGQTAPAPGITITNQAIYVDASNVVLQHFRHRLGDASAGTSNGIYVRKATNVVLDHLSVSWSTSTNISVNDQGLTPSVNNVAILDTLISENLINVPGSAAGDGVLFYGKTNSFATYARNLHVHNGTRNPRFGNGWQVSGYNNVCYNGGGNQPSGDAGEGHYSAVFASDPEYPVAPARVVWVGNVAIAGANSGPDAKAFKISLRADQIAGTAIYLSDNTGPFMTLGDQWGGVTFCSSGCGTANAATEANVKTTSVPAWHTALNITPLANASVKAAAIANAGARPKERDTPSLRDATDYRVVQDALNGTGMRIHSQTDVGGYPVIPLNSQTYNVPANPNNPGTCGQVSGGALRTIIECDLETKAKALEP